MKMEILLEPTSNKLMVEHAEFDESNTHVSERFNTSPGNPVKEILLKLNLPDHMSILTDLKYSHQLWRTLAALINRSLSGKTSGLDKLRLFRGQILWGMYHQKNVDYVELLWEDFIYHIDNKAHKKKEKLYYP
ncbi:hypothetical protein Tco_0697879 [Tanacetum coccineum]